MPPKDSSHRSHRSRRLAPLGLIVVALLVALPIAASTGSGPQTKRVAKVVESSDGGPVLANLRGRTLYSLSVEKHGRFICTAGCLSIWHPLVVPKGVKPTG